MGRAETVGAGIAADDDDVLALVEMNASWQSGRARTTRRRPPTTFTQNVDNI